MDDGQFQWDDAKAKLNFAVHGVTFEAARGVFADAFAIDWLDERENYGEECYAIIGMAAQRLLSVAYTYRGEAIRIISARGVEPYERRRYHEETSDHDWSRLDAMSEADRHSAALADPDAQPLTQERLARMKRTPQVKVIRRALGLSQEDFASRFHIPIGTLRDWEQGRKDPDAAARAYLIVIGRNPEAVSEALAWQPNPAP